MKLEAAKQVSESDNTDLNKTVKAKVIRGDLNIKNQLSIDKKSYEYQLIQKLKCYTNFRPKTLVGKETNWVQTVPEKVTGRSKKSSKLE